MENEISTTLKIFTADKKFAVGNDLVHVPGFGLSLTEPFKKKVYTDQEVDYCNAFADDLLRYASTWAAKEAVYKAVKQLDPSPLSWKKIEITSKKTAGEPVVTLHQHPNRFNISLTISHDGDYAWAIAFIEPNH